MKQRPWFGRGGFLLAAAVTWVAVGAVRSQVGEPPQPLAPPPPPPTIRGQPQPEPQPIQIELNLELLLHSRQVITERIDDPVWSFERDQNRVFVQVPFTIAPSETETHLTPSTLQFRGGRFVAWRIPERDEDATGGHRRGNRRAPARPGQRPPFPGQFPGPGQPFRAAALAQDDSEPKVDFISQFQVDPPRLARSLRITPDGVVHWPIERNVPNGQAGESKSLFAFKVNPRLFDTMRPQQPERRRENEDPQAYATRRREEMKQFQAANIALRDLRQAVAELPDEAEQAGITQIWAVIEMSRDARDFGIQGPPPLPWSITIRHLEAVRSMTEARQADRLDPSMVRELHELAQTKHEYSLRLIAMALGESGVLASLQANDQLMRVIRDVLNSPSQTGSEAMIEQLALTTPTPPAVRQLLGEAAPMMSPRAKLLALRSLLQVNSQDPAAARQAAVGITNALRDPNGADPGAVLTVALEVANQMPEHNQSLFVSAIQFEQLPDNRLDAAIAAVIGEAGIDPLAARWLDFKLLGATDVRLVGRTLELLSRAETGSAGAAPEVVAMLDFVFGPVSPEVQAAAAEAKATRVTLGARILVESINHSLFRAIQHGDPRLRGLAWESLHAFTFSPQVAEMGRQAELIRRAQEAGVDPGAIGGPRLPGGRVPARGPTPNRPTQPGQPQPFDPYRTLVDAALSGPSTPPQVVAFLASETASVRASDQLVRLVLTGDESTAARAAAALRRSGQPIDQSLAALDGKQRHAFGVAIYQQLQGRHPAVVGLLLDPAPNSPAATWFGSQLATSGLPDTDQWHNAYRNERMLLELAGAGDAQLTAGAVAALVSSVGGDEQAAIDFLATVNGLSDRSARSIGEAWSNVRQSIYKKRLAETAGRYRLVLNIYGTAGEAPPRRRPPPRPQPTRPQPGVPPEFMLPQLGQGGAFDANALPVEGPPSQVIQLGLVRFEVTGDAIRFADANITLSVPDTHLAIVIDKVSELKLLPIPDLATVPLEEVRRPLELNLRPGNEWSGWVQMPDQRYLELIMQPVE